MATRFEIVLFGENPVSLRAAAEEALDEIERLEGQLSLFKPTSPVSHLNKRAAIGPVRVDPPLFRLLDHARQLSEETSGAFDITVGPLMRCWGFRGGAGKSADPSELDAARGLVGMNLIEFNPARRSIRFLKEGVQIDLGAIGKGYALDCAADSLRDNGISTALIHGGTSTVYALGAPPDAAGWKIALELPSSSLPEAPGLVAPSDVAALPGNPLAILHLKDEALSLSAPTGRAFEVDGKILGHVLDPRTGLPVQGATLAAVILASATDTDALSTALLALGPEGHDQIARLRPNLRSLVVAPANPPNPARPWIIRSQGIDLLINKDRN